MLFKVLRTSLNFNYQIDYAAMVKTYPISSPQNKVYRVFKEILTTQGITKHGQALLFGQKVVNDTIRGFFSSDPKRSTWLAPSKALSTNGLEAPSSPIRGIIMTASMTLPRPSPENIYILDQPLFDELDIVGSKSPILVIEPPPMVPLEANGLDDGCHLVIPFQDPSNVGAVLRSAAAFGVKSILLLGAAAHPFHPRSVRAASGALLLHRYHRVASMTKLNDFACPIIALGAPGEEVTKFRFPKKFILVPGVEGPGLPADLKPHFKVSIAMNNELESLNAMVATSIALHQAFMQSHKI